MSAPRTPDQRPECGQTDAPDHIAQLPIRERVPQEITKEIAAVSNALQQISQEAAPSEETPASRRINPGWFRQGEPGPGLRHGGRSARVAAGLMPEQAEARAALEERQASIAASLGGPETLSPLALGHIDRHTRLEMVETYLFENVQRHGPLTGKGRTRAALSAWLQVVDRLQKSAMALGLERRQKPLNPLDAVRAAVSEANR